MKRLTLAIIMAFLFATTPALSSPVENPGPLEKYEEQYLAAYHKAAKAVGQAAVGRNVVLYGWRNERTGKIRLARRAEVTDATERLIAAAAPPPEPTTSYTTTPATGGYTSSTLEAIAACESGGDPAAVSPDGTYRGKYQFDYGTWASVGGSGDPAAASEAEQDYRAGLLYAQSGAAPWPVCGL